MLPNLPEEVWVHILANLSGKEILKVAHVNSVFLSVAEDHEDVWMVAWNLLHGASSQNGPSGSWHADGVTWISAEQSVQV